MKVAERDDEGIRFDGLRFEDLERSHCTLSPRMFGFESRQCSLGERRIGILKGVKSSVFSHYHLETKAQLERKQMQDAFDYHPITARADSHIKTNFKPKRSA